MQDLTSSDRGGERASARKDWLLSVSDGFPIHRKNVKVTASMRFNQLRSSGGDINVADAAPQFIGARRASSDMSSYEQLMPRPNKLGRGISENAAPINWSSIS